MTHSNETSKPCACSECEIQQMTRNHYFTGKLMVERDFTDEQRYFRGKLQRHNHHLHGSGVVCGLKVIQHPNDDCRDKYVIIEPGVAIDCCGHEIIVRDELRGVLLDPSGEPLKGALFNFAQDPRIKALRDANDVSRHPLQICLRYKECPTETIPVLYDECGCDDTQCAPNRILEGREFGVVLDGPFDAQDPKGVRLAWKHTVGYPHVAQAALHDASARLFVMTVDATGTAIYAIDTATGLTVDSVTTVDTVLAMTVSSDGKELYAATKIGILVLDAANLKAAAKATLSRGSEGGFPSELAAPPDGSLVALFGGAGGSGHIAFWDAPLSNGNTPSQVLNVSSALVGLLLSKDGKHAYLADKANHNVRVIDVVARTHANGDDIAVADPAPGSPTSAPSSVALAHSMAGDLLLVGDADNVKLYLVPLGSPSPPVSVVILNHPPAAVVVSPGAQWAYVLERDAAGTSFIQPVSIQRLLAGKPPLGNALPVGNNSGGISRSDSGETLYGPFNGDLGGVAIIDVTEQDCGDLLGRSLRGCPACDVPDCIILATMETYNLGDKLEDQTDPLADPTTDQTAKIARIDNRKGRQLLPSTQMLAAVLECLAEQGTGGSGQTGLPGANGAAGPGIDAADATPLPPGSLPTANLDPVGTPIRKLHLGIPRGDAGTNGSAGPGIDDADATPLPPGSSPTASLDPVGTPVRKLHLGIPAGNAGATGPRGPNAIVAAGRFDLNGSAFPSGALRGGIKAKPVPPGNQGLYDVTFLAFDPTRTTAEFVVKGIVILAVTFDLVRVFPVVNTVETNSGTAPPPGGNFIRVRISPPPDGKNILGFMLEVTDLKRF